MTSFVSNVLDSLKEAAERSLRREPAEGTGRRLVAGWSILVVSSVAVALLGVALEFNGFPLVVTILVGSSVLLGAAGDLAFGHQRELTRRLRILAVASLALAWLALAAMVFQLYFSS